MDQLKSQIKIYSSSNKLREDTRDCGSSLLSSDGLFTFSHLRALISCKRIASRASFCRMNSAFSERVQIARFLVVDNVLLSFQQQLFLSFFIKVFISFNSLQNLVNLEVCSHNFSFIKFFFTLSQF